MLILRLKSEPYWLDLPLGVRLHVLPFGRALGQAAREDIATSGGDEDDDEDPGMRLEAICLAVAKRGIIEWEGVGTTGDDAADVTETNIEMLLDNPSIWATFLRDYINPGFGVITEGNVSAPSPNGTSEKARTTARTARVSVPSAPPA